MTSEETEQTSVVSKALSAFRWVAALRFLGQFITWMSTIFVIRFLAPEDFGIISLAEVFRTLLVLFSTMGLSQGLIGTKELKPQMIRQTLGLLVLINVLLFFVQFFSAPYVADFYNTEELEWVLKISAFSYLLVPWTTIPFSLIARDLGHQKSSKVFFLSSILSSFLSLTLAYLGYGYWALVSATIFSGAFNCLGLNFIHNYPRLPSFSFRGAGALFQFGAFIAISDLLWVAYNKVDVAIAGVYFDVGQVGFYAVALQLGTMLMTKSMPLFNVVAFPAFARLNDLEGGSNKHLITALRIVSMLIFPIFFGVAFVGEHIIYLLLGEDWTRISVIFAILVVSVPFRILAFIISPAILASGAAKANVGISFATLVFITVMIFLLLRFELTGLATAWSLASIFTFVLTIFTGSRVLSIPLKTLAASLAPPLVAALVMSLALTISDFGALESHFLIIAVKVMLGAFVYIGFCWFFFRSRSLELISGISRLAGKQ